MSPISYKREKCLNWRLAAVYVRVEYSRVWVGVTWLQLVVGVPYTPGTCRHVIIRSRIQNVL
jgi:hypothetical protein